MIYTRDELAPIIVRENKELLQKMDAVSNGEAVPDNERNGGNGSIAASQEKFSLQPMMILGIIGGILLIALVLALFMFRFKKQKDLRK